jgi:hypothetical protein
MPRLRFLLLVVGLGVNIFLPLCAAAEGKITANPDPCVITVKMYTCTTYLSWTVTGATQARVYVTEHSKQGNPEHQFKNGLACTPTSQKCRAPWIRKGNTYDFTLYDYSTGSRGRALSAVTVTATGWSRDQGPRRAR